MSVDKIEALQKQVDDLTRERDAAIEALKPFAEAPESLDDKHGDTSDIWESPAAMEIKAGDLRRARDCIDALTQQLARHEAHEYEHRAWAAEAQIKELTRERDEAQRLFDNARTFSHDLNRDMNSAVAQLTTATAQIAALREELKDARDTILQFVYSSSEAEGSDADWVGSIDAILTATEPAKESE